MTELVNTLLQPAGRADRTAHAAATGKTKGADGSPDRLRQTAEEFEAVFLAQALQALTYGLSGAGPFGSGENDAFAGMLQQEYGRLMSRSGGIGIADAVLKEMLKI